jgi:hypothetical protein
MIGQPRKRGRKPVVTPERIEMICGLLAKGESEKSACIRAGIGLTAWNTAKRSNASLRQRIAEARDDWARLRHKQHAAALYESQSTRSANRKALKPQPTRQAKLVAWHLTFRVPLHFAAIPETDIKEACERFGMSLDRWQRQERAFGLLGKVYAKRAKLRGEQAAIATAPNGPAGTRREATDQHRRAKRHFGRLMIARPIAGLVRLGVCQPGRRFLAMLALFSEPG